jgi:hypothetical protein
MVGLDDRHVKEMHDHPEAAGFATSMKVKQRLAALPRSCSRIFSLIVALLAHASCPQMFEAWQFACP